MATTTLDKEVLDLEKRYWDAMKNNDPATIESLTGDNYLMIMEEGVSSSPRKEMARMLTSQDFRVRSYSIDEKKASVQKVGNDFAIVAYPVHNEFERAGKLEKRDAYALSVWARQGGKWQVVAGADTPASTPR